MSLSHNAPMQLSKGMRDKLPKNAQAAWLKAALAEQRRSPDDYNGAVRAGWAAVKKEWWQPEQSGPWMPRPQWAREAERGERRKATIEMTRIVAKNEEQRIVWLWASVITENGAAVIDEQGDIIEPEELVLATTEFMKESRIGKVGHAGSPIGDVVHSLPLTYELAKLFGLQSEREGWITAIYVRDDETWRRVKAGELVAGSIGGRSDFEPLEAERAA